MAKTRMLKHELRTSEKVASWPIELRYFWVLLWGYVDDHGKAKDNALLVKADCFPLDEEITREVVDGWLWDLAREGVVDRYTVHGTEYLAIHNWREHQKPPHPTKDVIPGPESPGAVRRAPHEECMNDAGEVHESFTPELGWVGSENELGSELSAHLTASVTFDDFWDVWQKKVAKADAEKAWAKAIKKADAQLIVDAARALWESPYLPDKQFIPYPASWLNGERWNDPLPEPPQQQQRPSRDQANMAFVASLGGQKGIGS